MESVQANDVIIDNQHGARRGRGDSYCCPEGSRWKRGCCRQKRGGDDEKRGATLCMALLHKQGWFWLVLSSLKDVDFDET